jgi:hypothetical protein
MAQGASGLRRGSPVAFWGTLGGTNGLVPQGASVSTGTQNSAAVQTGRGTCFLAIYVSSSVTASFNVQTAHAGAFTGQGIPPDPDDQSFTWCNLVYLSTSATGLGTPIVINGTGAWATCIIVPDFEPDWIRLQRTDSGSTASVFAGFEAWGN